MWRSLSQLVYTKNQRLASNSGHVYNNIYTTTYPVLSHKWELRGSSKVHQSRYENSCLSILIINTCLHVTANLQWRGLVINMMLEPFETFLSSFTHFAQWPMNVWLSFLKFNADISLYIKNAVSGIFTPYSHIVKWIRQKTSKEML